MTTLKFNVVIGVKAASVITFSNVDLFFAALVVRSLDVNLSIGVAAVRISVAVNNMDVNVVLS